LRYEADGTATECGCFSSTGWAFTSGARWSLEQAEVLRHMLDGAQTARIYDYSQLGGEIAEAARRRGFRSTIAFPVVVSGRLWGAIVVFSTETLPKGTDARLGYFTELLATAIADAESRETLAALAEEQAALLRVATLVAEGAPPGTIFSAVSNEIALLFDLDSKASDVATVVRFDPGSEFVLVGTSKSGGVAIPSRWGPRDLYVSTRVLRTGCSARVDEQELVMARGHVADELRGLGYLSQVGSPIIVEGALWGAITINARDPLPPDAEGRLARFTALVRTAIANAESRMAVARLADEQAALRRVAELVAREASPDELFTCVTEEVGRLLGVGVATMHVFPGDGTFTTVAAWDAAGRMMPLGPRGRLDPATVTGRVMESGASARVNRYIDLHDELGGPGPHRFLHSAVSAPIVVEGRLWGALTAGNRASTPAPEDAETRIAAFTELVAVAISNADARRDLRRVGDEQAALRRVATLVAQGVQRSELFGAVSAELADVFRTEFAAVGRFDRDVAAIDVVGLGIDGPQRWTLQDKMPAARVLRTGRSARSDHDSWRSGHATSAEPIGRLRIVSSVASPIVVEGELWGAMLVASTKDVLPPDTEGRLENFTELVATAIANSESRAELAASRRRIVAAADEARQRIERDLHDGIQQRLVGLTLRARALTRLPPDEFRSMASELADGLGAAADELREVSHGIHPTILTQAGLGPALRALSRRSGVPIAVDVTIESRLPGPVEVAAYYAASEALANVAKHAQASVVALSASCEHGILALEVRDDGIGGVDPSRGTGILGLKDRVEALGGTISVESPSGGTTLSLRLPTVLGSAQDEARRVT
jgi:signal transduction histidine kinase